MGHSHAEPGKRYRDLRRSCTEALTVDRREQKICICYTRFTESWEDTRKNGVKNLFAEYTLVPLYAVPYPTLPYPTKTPVAPKQASNPTEKQNCTSRQRSAHPFLKGTNCSSRQHQARKHRKKTKKTKTHAVTTSTQRKTETHLTRNVVRDVAHQAEEIGQRRRFHPELAHDLLVAEDAVTATGKVTTKKCSEKYVPLSQQRGLCRGHPQTSADSATTEDPAITFSLLGFCLFHCNARGAPAPRDAVKVQAKDRTTFDAHLLGCMTCTRSLTSWHMSLSEEHTTAPNPAERPHLTKKKRKKRNRPRKTDLGGRSLHHSTDRAPGAATRVEPAQPTTYKTTPPPQPPSPRPCRYPIVHNTSSLLRV